MSGTFKSSVAWFKAFVEWFELCAISYKRLDFYFASDCLHCVITGQMLINALRLNEACCVFLPECFDQLNEKHKQKANSLI